MKNEILVYVVGPDKHYARFIENSKLTDDIKSANIVLFTGGEDVCPDLYGAKKHQYTYCNIDRDLYEKDIFNKISPKQLAVGVCRGSQFLCVMNGGLLIQDVNNHAIYGTHPITNGSTSYEITSTHHQMQYPFNLNKEDYDILFYSEHPLSTYYSGDKIDRKKIIVEPEIVLYNVLGNPKCLAIQGHPEMMSLKHPTVLMINKLIDELL